MNANGLKITGNFYDSIKASKGNNELQILSSGFDDGSEIIKKYGDNILGVSDTAIEYFNKSYLMPWLEDFYKSCGYEL